ncbi:hypothetical protein WJX73_000501 [Symbiochloris irregularis]|uniref:Arginine deiminase n=1 Tax=Symbiochloris irregularis TaxID=706552 RepID=A0AAW1P8F6_9CHLO
MVESALLFSRSHQDVADLAQPPLAPKRGAGGNQAGSLGRLSEANVPTACQQHENEPAEVVIVCEPEGTSLMMGGLHPRASLYERPVNLDAARASHAEFRRVMREAGLRVLTVREILSFGVGDHIGARVELEELAMKALSYNFAEGFKEADLRDEDRVYVTDDYKRVVLEHMSIEQLIDTLMINPTVHLSPSYRDTGLSASYTFQPLSNLVYTRDQQITGCKGIIMGRLRSKQRQLECDLMRFCFTKLGFQVIGEIKAPGFLEGGDFFPAGRDLALVGVGLRSNFEACQQLMNEDLLGVRRLAVVRDENEMHQDRMHLDCVFSILSDDCCLMLKEMIGEQSPTCRVVDEFTQDVVSNTWTITRERVEFAAYMRDNGFHIIEIDGADQLLYGCNVLNLGDGKVISVHSGTARQIVRDPHFHGDVQVVDFTPITSMYGAVHCSSQVVKRTPRRTRQIPSTEAGLNGGISALSSSFDSGIKLGGSSGGHGRLL